MNALTVAMYAEMAGALEHAADAPDVRMVLIHGHPAVITSGDDLADRMNTAPGSGDRSVHCDLVYAGEATCFHRLGR